MAQEATGPLRCADCHRPLKPHPLNLATGLGRGCARKRPETDPAYQLVTAYETAAAELGYRQAQAVTAGGLLAAIGEEWLPLIRLDQEPTTGLERMALRRWRAALQLAQVHGVDRELHIVRENSPPN